MFYFYLFQTQVDNHYKFGYTERPFHLRLNEYKGLNTPKVVYLTLYSKFNLEDIFKDYLKDNGIDIIVGNEYFKYEEDMFSFVKEFLIFYSNFNIEDYEETIVNDKYYCELCSKQCRNKSHYDYHLGSKEHMITLRSKCNV